MLKAGTVLGSYEIVAPIGAGGMGVVYRGKHVMLGNPVAVKVLLANFAMSEKVRVRFRQEAYVQANVQHPNIVRVTDMVSTDDALAIVMDLVEGPSLEDALTTERCGQWALEDALAVMRPVLDAVAAAHARGVVHRDLKPGNVLLERRDESPWPGVPRVTDFGLAKILSSEVAMTRTGARMGTVPYMSPEQFEGHKGIGTPADVYALAMMLWRMLSGRLPINPDNTREILGLYAGDVRIPPLTEARPDVPSGISQAIEQALAENPADRTQDARAFRESLSTTTDKIANPMSASAAKPSVLGPTPANRSTPPVASDVKQIATGEGSSKVTGEDVLKSVSHCGQAQVAAKEGDLDEALKMYREALTLDPLSSQAAENVPRLETALFENLVDEAKKNARAADVQGVRSQLEKAEALAQQAHTLQGRMADAKAAVEGEFLQTAEALEEAAHLKGAMSILEKAQQVLGSSSSLHEKWGSLAAKVRELGAGGMLLLDAESLIQKNQFNEALQLLRQARDRDTNKEQLSSLTIRAISGLATQALASEDLTTASSLLDELEAVVGNEHEGLKRLRQTLKRHKEDVRLSGLQVLFDKTDESIRRGDLVHARNLLGQVTMVGGGFDPRFESFTAKIVQKERAKLRAEMPRFFFLILLGLIIIIVVVMMLSR